MEDPSKSDIETIFKRLKTIPSNKVSPASSSERRLLSVLLPLDVFRLRCKKSDVGIGDVRRLLMY